jgi:hypothetical protein
LAYEVGLGFIYTASASVSGVILPRTTDLPLATGHGDVDETTGVSEPLLCAALGSLLLLLGLNLLSCVSLRLCLVSSPSPSPSDIGNKRSWLVAMRFERSWRDDVSMLTLAGMC